MREWLRWRRQAQLPMDKTDDDETSFGEPNFAWASRAVDVAAAAAVASLSGGVQWRR
jgi:hypothetical protein